MIFLFKNNLVRILTLFSLSPGSRFNRKRIQEKTYLNNISLDNSLSYLINLRIFKREKNLYSLNFENSSVGDLVEKFKKYYFKLKQLPLKEYFMILDIVEDFLRIEGVDEVYLFGSYSKLIFTDKSDIDFAIISEEINEKRFNDVVNKLEKQFKKKIEIHFFDKDFYKNRKDPLVREIITHGVSFLNS